MAEAYCGNSINLPALIAPGNPCSLKMLKRRLARAEITKEHEEIKKEPWQTCIRLESTKEQINIMNREALFEE